MKLLASALFSFLVATSAVGQSGVVIVNVNGITCTLLEGKTGFEATSYSLGGTVKTGNTENPNITKAPTLDALSVGKNFDECSEPLLRLFLGSTAVPTLTLMQFQRGEPGQTSPPTLTITLTNAIMTSYEVTGAPAVNPTEILTFKYRTVCVASVSQNPDGTFKPPVTVCYDTVKKQLS